MTDQPGAAPEERGLPLQIPPLMTKVPTNVQCAAGEGPDGLPTVLLLIQSANGNFGWPLEPEQARAIARALMANADEADSRTGGLIKPPTGLLIPGR